MLRCFIWCFQLKNKQLRIGQEILCMLSPMCSFLFHVVIELKEDLCSREVSVCDIA